MSGPDDDVSLEAGNPPGPRCNAPSTQPSVTDVAPFSLRVAPIGGDRPFKDLGASPFARKYGSPDRQATGHWCSRCQGIWYGYLLEVTCPVCGNRHG